VTAVDFSESRSFRDSDIALVKALKNLTVLQLSSSQITDSALHP
jgi:hypothetical protein